MAISRLTAAPMRLGQTLEDFWSLCEMNHILVDSDERRERLLEIINPRVHAELEAASDWQTYWAQVGNRVHWNTPFHTLYAKIDGTSQWFLGGTTNLAVNALDAHVATDPEHMALVSIQENGTTQTYTYAELSRLVLTLSRAYRALGVAPGDRVAIYMPTGPEAIASMLALSRIGAIHLVVFAGFGSAALAQRIRLSGAKLLIASDVTWRKGNSVALTSIVANALKDPASPIQKIVWHCRQSDPPQIPNVAYYQWNELEQLGQSESDDPEWMDANAPAFILATSGTTAEPKLVVHTHGAYQAGLLHTSRVMFGLNASDIWWSTSDIGWIVGHSFIVYAPLLIGATTLTYEGALDYPGPEHFYQILQDQHVTGIFTAPTAVRLLNRYGVEPAKPYDLTSVEKIFSAGEPLNPPAWEMFQRQIFEDKVSVIDHWWQTETGGPVIGNPYGLGQLPIRPGSAGIALPGYAVEVRRPDGTLCEDDEPGSVVITRPFPGLTAKLWGDSGNRYEHTYWSEIPDTYLTGDAASRDSEGYFWFRGRSDEVLKIAAHRIGTSEVESALLKHPAVSEAGVTGLPDDLRGEVIAAFVVLRPGQTPGKHLEEELRQTIRHELGPVAVVGRVEFVPTLPKTRSGKIMRRLLKSVVLDQDQGDISTIEDPSAVDAARTAWKKH